mmetsp:Transcript_3170/g.6786  ORF Transcript_3170/g.6786 Transcript_3170/m.6786 type:complete len:102 (+) Transcript_3170:2-307(+)
MIPGEKGGFTSYQPERRKFELLIEEKKSPYDPKCPSMSGDGNAEKYRFRVELNGEAKHSIPKKLSPSYSDELDAPNHFDRQLNTVSCIAPCIPPPLQSLSS